MRLVLGETHSNQEVVESPVVCRGPQLVPNQNVISPCVIRRSGVREVISQSQRFRQPIRVFVEDDDGFGVFEVTLLVKLGWHVDV